jgi:hypothetical protein
MKSIRNKATREASCKHSRGDAQDLLPHQF